MVLQMSCVNVVGEFQAKYTGIFNQVVFSRNKSVRDKGAILKSKSCTKIALHRNFISGLNLISLNSRIMHSNDKSEKTWQFFF